MMPPGSTIIEVLPRTFCRACFCEMAASNNMTILQYGQGNGKYRFYKWCGEEYLDSNYYPKVMCGGKPYPKPVMNEQYHHTLLAEMPYLDGEEVEVLVAEVGAWRGQGGGKGPKGDR
jgi:hypothetical protein